MKESEIFSPSRIERLLKLACAYKIPVSLVAESRGQAFQYTSRMLEASEGPGTKHLTLDHPTTDGPAIALKPETKVKLLFAIDQGQFIFESTVLSKTTLTLKDGKKIPTLQVEYPNSLKHNQRRAHFRVPIPIEKPITATCSIIGDTNKPVPGDGDTLNFSMDEEFQGRPINISVGGILMALEEADIKLLDPGTRLLIRFSLAKDETAFALKGIIRRIDKKPSTGELRVAIEFVETEKTFENKLAINRLYKYVTKIRGQQNEHGRK